MDILGDINGLSREELENAVYLQKRALDIAVGWYLRSLERHDRFEYKPAEHTEVRDRLASVAMTDAFHLIAYEERQRLLRGETAHLERSDAVRREDELRQEIQEGKQ